MSEPPTIPLSERLLPMLPDELRDAVVEARTRLSDQTIMARIEDYQDRPGFVVVERAGTDLQGALSQDAAIAYLEALT